MYSIFFSEKLVNATYKNFLMKAGFISYKIQKLCQVMSLGGCILHCHLY